ncbi:hypothetical protein GQR58_000809 [Nymphon striatum]|nr:hypothetical protein GQR58_000809 [Nymphon striatum]
MDHINNARWLLVHIYDLHNLPSKIEDEFIKGSWVVSRSQRSFSSIPIDQCHEQLNKHINGVGGAVGLMNDPAAFSFHPCTSEEEFLTCLQGKETSSSSKITKKVKTLGNGLSLFCQMYVAVTHRDETWMNFSNTKLASFHLHLQTENKSTLEKKSDILKYLQNSTPTVIAPPNCFDCTIFDGAAVMHALQPNMSTITFDEYANKIFVPYLRHQLKVSNEIHACRLGYLPGGQTERNHQGETWRRKDKAQGLLVFHAITGSDTASAFANKGKLSSWKAWSAVTETGNLTLHLMYQIKSIVKAICRLCDKQNTKFVPVGYQMQCILIPFPLVICGLR